MSEIDWSNAPEWAERAIESGGVAYWVRVCDGGNKLRIQPLSGGNSWLAMRDSPLVQRGKALSSRPSAGGGTRHDHYRVKMKGVTVDAYDIIDACAVTCPALQHIAKKALFTGKRGHKSTQEDLENIIDTAIRALELHHERQ